MPDEPHGPTGDRGRSEPVAAWPRDAERQRSAGWQRLLLRVAVICLSAVILGTIANWVGQALAKAA